MADLPKRKPARLKEYDYSVPGAYFVTVCTHQKLHLFGKVVNGEMQLNDLGTIVHQEILKIEAHYDNVKVDKFIVMPNHVHMIIVLLDAEGINPFPTKQYDIPNIIGKLKAGVTRIVGNVFMHSANKPIWQRSFHDHIIRNEQDYLKIWNYIDTNAGKWEQDCFYVKEKE